jgi:L-amino acid N-acyltransferase YncA
MTPLGKPRLPPLPPLYMLPAMITANEQKPPPLEAVKIRPAKPRDMATIQAIYAHNVRHGLASFEEEPPDEREMTRRRARIVKAGLPYLIAETAGQVAGYCYAAPFHHRSAYRYTLENSVYVSPQFLRCGIGSRLLEALIAQCTELGYRQMIAVIGDTANAASINLHRRAGFEMAGTLAAAGFKFGRWVDSVYMQRSLGEGGRSQPPEPDGPAPGGIAKK